MTDQEYLEQQCNNVMVDRPENIKMKLISETGETKWIDITRKQVNAMLDALIETL